MICSLLKPTRLLVLVLVVLLAAPIAPPCAAQDEDQPVIAPANPAFEAYSEPRNASASVSGLIPEPFDSSGINRRPAWSINAVLPPAYDLRAAGRLTPVKNQGSCGSCWAFATIGSLESTLMPGEPSDFSENNLKNLSGFSFGSCTGGNRGMSTAYLVRWGGPIAEVEDPYVAGSSSSPTGFLPRKHVQEVLFLPNRSSSLDNSALKEAVMTYGAAYTTYFHSDSYYRSSTASYYYNGASQPNHAVCIVGWDDGYPASNFATAPPGNGAFLIRNSWGTYWASGGYAWISYYDNVLGKSENAVFRAEANTNYDYIYQYDPLGWIGSTGYNSATAWFANVFTATSDCAIAAAGFYTPAPDSTYTLYVYRGVTTSPVYASGLQATVSGTLPSAGYHTVQLPSSVQVSAGQKFSVVVRLTTPDYDYPVCVEAKYSGFSDAATSGSGQGYISSNGTSWLDMAQYWVNASVCLKAYAVNSGAAEPAPGVLSVSSTTGLNAAGSAGGPFAPSSVTYTLRNTGESPLNWAATPSANWIGVSAAGGVLAAGGQATLTVSISANANSLTAGSYSGSVSFANLTGGYGSASRSVSLAISPAQRPGTLSVVQTTGLTSSGKVGGPFSPSSATYTLRNTGKASLSWTARGTTNWVSVSRASGTLAAGASTNITVSINSTANVLAAGTHADTVSFTNATNGMGNTSRAVALTVTAPAPVQGAYTLQPEAYSWLDSMAYTRLNLADNAVSGRVTLPFPFTYYGRSYTGIYVGSNGLLGFGTSGMTSSNNGNLPYPTSPNGVICPYWDDLNPKLAGSVRVISIGVAPNRKVVVSWIGVPLRNNTATKLTFQAILCEGSNDIIFQYQDVGSSSYGAGAGATVGIENETGRQACKYSYNTRSLRNVLALRFTTHGVAAKTKTEF